MLKPRITATLRFFALQDIPLTLFEVHKYLLADLDIVKQHLNKDWEAETISTAGPTAAPVSLAEVQACLDTECAGEVKSYHGYYYLADKTEDFVTSRLHSYIYGIYRERIIARHSRGLRYIPFLRSMGVVGSQALGKYKPGSDIDVLIIMRPGYLWLGRFFVTLYFQLAGVRRYGTHVANRFCLNHYLVGPKALHNDRNVYTASEYVKARPLYHAGLLNEFKRNNEQWITLFFPNLELAENKKTPPPRMKLFMEKVFTNKFGRWLEQRTAQAGRMLESQAGRYQLHRIRRDKFVVVEEDELSFHPDNRKAQLFAAFFEHE